MTWPTAMLAEVVVSIRNGVFARRPTDEPRGSRILRISAVRDGRVNIADSRFVDGLDAAQVIKFSVDPGDLLMTRYNGSRALVGIAGLVPKHSGPVIHPDKLIRIVLDTSQILPAFANYQLSSPAVRLHLEPRIRTTAGQSGIAGADVRSIPLAVPSLDEQRRIVDLLEDHLSRLDAADAYLTSSHRRLLAMERSVLAELHEGPTKRLGELAIGSGYGTSEKCVADGPGVAVVRIPNLSHGRIDLGDEKRVADPAADVSSSILAPGDLLIVRTNGSVDLIGRSAVVQDGINAAYASYLIRYRLDLRLVRPEWVQAMLSAPQVRRTIEPLAASSAGQHNLSLAKLNPLEVPLPSLGDQDRGLKRLNDLRQTLSRTHADLKAGRARSDALRRSVLAAAFSGRLTGNVSELSEAKGMMDA